MFSDLAQWKLYFTMNLFTSCSVDFMRCWDYGYTINCGQPHFMAHSSLKLRSDHFGLSFRLLKIVVESGCIYQRWLRWTHNFHWELYLLDVNLCVAGTKGCCCRCIGGLFGSGSKIGLLGGKMLFEPFKSFGNFCLESDFTSYSTHFYRVSLFVRVSHARYQFSHNFRVIVGSCIFLSFGTLKQSLHVRLTRISFCQHGLFKN